MERTVNRTVLRTELLCRAVSQCWILRSKRTHSVCQEISLISWLDSWCAIKVWLSRGFYLRREGIERDKRKRNWQTEQLLFSFNPILFGALMYCAKAHHTLSGSIHFPSATLIMFFAVWVDLIQSSFLCISSSVLFNPLYLMTSVCALYFLVELKNNEI